MQPRNRDRVDADKPTVGVCRLGVQTVSMEASPRAWRLSTRAQKEEGRNSLKNILYTCLYLSNQPRITFKLQLNEVQVNLVCKLQALQQLSASTHTNSISGPHHEPCCKGRSQGQALLGRGGLRQGGKSSVNTPVSRVPGASFHLSRRDLWALHVRVPHATNTQK